MTLTFIALLAGSAGVAAEDPTSYVEVKNTGSTEFRPIHNYEYNNKKFMFLTKPNLI